jgi:hypothetical protein
MLFKTLGDADLKSLKMPELVRQAVKKVEMDGPTSQHWSLA